MAKSARHDRRKRAAMEPASAALGRCRCLKLALYDAPSDATSSHTVQRSEGPGLKEMRSESTSCSPVQRVRGWAVQVLNLRLHHRHPFLKMKTISWEPLDTKAQQLPVIPVVLPRCLSRVVALILHLQGSRDQDGVTSAYSLP